MAFKNLYKYVNHLLLLISIPSKSFMIITCTSFNLFQNFKIIFYFKLQIFRFYFRKSTQLPKIYNCTGDDLQQILL